MLTALFSIAQITQAETSKRDISFEERIEQQKEWLRKNNEKHGGTIAISPELGAKIRGDNTVSEDVKSFVDSQKLNREEALNILSNKNNGGNANADENPYKQSSRETRWLVFASLSLGKQGLSDLLSSASGREIMVVFRGIPEEMSLGKGVMVIQKLAAEHNPVPNIIIDPTLFRQYNIKVAPTIIYKEAGEEGNEVARVRGLASINWLLQQVANGEKGDLGLRGDVQEIAEPDLIDVAKQRAANIDWDKKKQDALDGFWRKQSFDFYPTATTYRKREIDPIVVVTEDIIAPNGQVIAKKGAHINPLEQRPWTQAVVIFDATNSKERKAISMHLPAIMEREGLRRKMYLTTDMDTDRGWDAYKELTDEYSSPIYLLKPEVASRFQIEKTPSVVTARDGMFVVEELTAFEGDSQ